MRLCSPFKNDFYTLQVFCNNMLFASVWIIKQKPKCNKVIFDRYFQDVFGLYYIQRMTNVLSYMLKLQDKLIKLQDI